MAKGNSTRTAGVLLVVMALLLFVPVGILGAAINWPASLDEPAAVVLPLIAEEASAVRLGYLVYLAYSILFWPTALLTARVVAGSDNLGPLLRIALGFAAVSTLARSLGIVRWLVAMPALASSYADPAASETSRATITIVYQALNAYGGSIGELLGVGLFAALWLGPLALAGLRTGTLPRWLGVYGLVAAIGLLTGLVELFGIDLGPLITVTTTLLQLWFLAAGIVLLVRREPAHAVHTAAL